MVKEILKKNKSTAENNLWIKCKKCEQIIYVKEAEENFKVCPKCGYYIPLNPYERINMLLEPGSFKEYDKYLFPVDVLGFPGYKEKIKKLQKICSSTDAVVTGEGMMGTHRVVICVMDFDFLGGSMGSVVGEKITRAIETAMKKKFPLIIVSASGGARMHEGIFSLMQMAKTSSAIGKLHKEKLPFISVLTNPTSGGVTASFAMLGDINIAEPQAFIGFAGPRVIEQTIKQKLPEGFQSAEFAFNHGMIDMIVERKNLKSTIIKILNCLNSNRKRSRK